MMYIQHQVGVTARPHPYFLRYLDKTYEFCVFQQIFGCFCDRFLLFDDNFGGYFCAGCTKTQTSIMQLERHHNMYKQDLASAIHIINTYGENGLSLFGIAIKLHIS